MAELNLKSPIPAYLAADRNAWQTAPEIAAGSGIGVGTVRSNLTNYKRRGHVEVRGRRGTIKQYRLNPEALAVAKAPKPKSKTVAAIRADFCRKWRVKHPYQATRNNPEAMTDWLERLAP